MKDTFCVVPWIHLNPEPDGKVKPCCAYFDGKPFPTLQNNTLEEIWNGDTQKEIRRQFLSNETPNGCKSCVQREDSYGHSLRMAMNERFEKYIEPAKQNTEIDGTYNKFELVYWDFRFSNICNFKCRMCGHTCSSQWYEETVPYFNDGRPKILDKSYYGKDLMIYVNEFIDIVEEIYFAGGEPLLMTEHYEILDMLVEKERFDVFLRYNTNLSTLKYKSYDLINIWKKFKKVEIYASIDGFGENAEYSRHGTDWPKIEKNLIAIINSGLEVRIAMTVNVFNIFHIPDLLLYLVNIGVDLKIVVPTILSFPLNYKISILPDDIKLKIKETFQRSLATFPTSEQEQVKSLYDGIIVVLDQPSDAQAVVQFYSTTKMYDVNRNENILKVVPEYNQWFLDLEKNKKDE
jgi:radical SAM protein with 4Fe4S-binding SPASM domain